MRTIEDGTAGFVSLLFISDTRTARGRLFQSRFSSLCLLCVSVKKLVRCLSGFTFHILTLTASSNKRSHGIFHTALLSFVTWPIWSTKCPSYSKQNLVGKVKWCAYGHKTHQGKGVRKQRSTFVLLAAFMSKRALLTWKKLFLFPPTVKLSCTVSPRYISFLQSWLEVTWVCKIQKTGRLVKLSWLNYRLCMSRTLVAVSTSSLWQAQGCELHESSLTELQYLTFTMSSAHTWAVAVVYLRRGYLDLKFRHQ